MMHYSVTTPYSGIPELVQLLLTIAILFSLGIIGWVFGVSLLVNSIVQMCKALPVMFKMMMGSIQGFAEGLLIVFSVILEMLVTIALYCLSVYIIDFLIRLIRRSLTTSSSVPSSARAPAIMPPAARPAAAFSILLSAPVGMAAFVPRSALVIFVTTDLSEIVMATRHFRRLNVPQRITAVDNRPATIAYVSGSMYSIEVVPPAVTSLPKMDKICTHRPRIKRIKKSIM